MRVISIDPGGISGYCYARIEGGIISYAPFQVQDEVDDLWRRLHAFQPVHIVIEDFEFRGGARRGLDLFPVQLIGVTRLYAYTGKLPCALHVQKAATGKAYYTDQVLKANDLYRRGCGHGMDAARHLLQWFTFGFGHQYQGQDRNFARLIAMESFT
jgi:hypothetical protein